MLVCGDECQSHVQHEQWQEKFERCWTVVLKVETIFGDDSHIMHWRRHAKNPMQLFSSRGTLRKIMGLGRDGTQNASTFHKHALEGK